MSESEIIKAGIEMPKSLHKRMKGVANQLDLKIREAVIEALELWLSQHEPQAGAVTVVTRIPAELHEAMLNYGRAHHLHVEQIILEALNQLLAEPVPDESTRSKSVEITPLPSNLLVDPVLSSLYAPVFQLLQAEGDDPTMNDFRAAILSVAKIAMQVMRPQRERPGDAGERDSGAGEVEAKTGNVAAIDGGQPNEGSAGSTEHVGGHLRKKRSARPGSGEAR